MVVGGAADPEVDLAAVQEESDRKKALPRRARGLGDSFWYW
jgi:hypothetical protein